MSDVDVTGIADAMHQNRELIAPAFSYIQQKTDGLVTDTIGLLIGDFIKVKRAERLQILWNNAKKRLESKGIVPTPMSPVIGQPLLEAACLEDREELTKLWESLLEAALDPDRTQLVRRSFIETLKQMDPPDAEIFKYLEKRNNRQQMYGSTKYSKENAEITLSNLIRLGLLEHYGPDVYMLTNFGIELKRTLGENIY